MRGFEPMVVSTAVTVAVDRRHLFIQRHATNDRDDVAVEALGSIPLKYVRRWSRESLTANSVLVVELPGPGAVDVLEAWRASIETAQTPSPPPPLQIHPE